MPGTMLGASYVPGTMPDPLTIMPDIASYYTLIPRENYVNYMKVEK